MLRRYNLIFNRDKIKPINQKYPKPIMENTNTLDLITGGIALLILIGGMLMMFTTIFTTKKNK